MKIIKRKTRGDYGSDRSEAKAFFVENYEEGMILNVKATAKSLGVSRPTIYSWIKEIKESQK